MGLVFRVKMLEACNRVTPDEGRNDTLKNTIMIIIRRGESCRGWGDQWGVTGERKRVESNATGAKHQQKSLKKKAHKYTKRQSKRFRSQNSHSIYGAYHTDSHESRKKKVHSHLSPQFHRLSPVVASFMYELRVAIAKSKRGVYCPIEIHPEVL